MIATGSGPAALTVTVGVGIGGTLLDRLKLARPAALGYSYRAGVLPDASTDQGLLFLAYVKDPTTSFVPVQRRLAAHDALNAFTLTTGSALFAVLPGVGDEADRLGRSLLG